MDQFKRDVQKEEPRLVVGLNRVGVKNIQKIIRIKNNNKENLFYSTIDIFVDLLPQQKGAHMSRFDETITQIIDETIQKKVMVIEDFATYMAEMARKRQNAHRAEVRIKAKYPVEEIAPASEKKTQKINTIMGRAVSTENGSRHLIGVETNGMTVCPCAQQMIKEYAEDKLEKEGFTKEQLEKVFKHIPMPSHNQRGTGILMIGSEKKIKAEKLVRIVENSMSSKVLDLLKRVDELEIVRNAHLNPRFVEDVVREMVALTLKEFDFLSDDDYFLAKQTNYEGIHSYEVYAERSGTIGEIKEEIKKAENDYLDEDYIINCNNTSSDEWLESNGGC
ncbi:GTP cyclohydrolase I type 2 [Halanaerobium saccharolyticum subsp. saccharolyticum DSM 6643]|uniref:GTP cyclohydrolase I type 2 n=1 Tax=Halanaerobium saccharolyticum subsp. saccharolyticum DSM 6643 TaxID=1293054 RepID=M5DYN2_9FIRM|nr:GTP cyclohydrolase MptA [Halanaerobium saccharolyticum]CCU78283.1 GTP cyclohydrolase I type 2 [Halanaerobium saccharolyticum subsp. saccharolyticum DSM 6643]